MDKLLRDMETLCKDARRRMKRTKRHDTGWQEQQIEADEMAAIKCRDDIKKVGAEMAGWDDYIDINDYLDTIKYMNVADYMDMKKNCNTEDLLRLLEAEILIYNMENVDG